MTINKYFELKSPMPQILNPPCTSDPELFFPDSYQIEPYLAAKEVCMTCPAIESCKTFAVENKVEDGVWGGTTPHERGVWRMGVPRKKEDFERYINLEKYYTAAQLCSRLKISQITLSKLVQDGTYPPPTLRLLGVFYWKRDEIEQETEGSYE